MDKKKHYIKTKEYYQISALKRFGFYDAKNEGPYKHSIWQLLFRKGVLNIINELFLSTNQNKKICGIGCGKGDFLFEISKKFSNIENIFGCDFSYDAVNLGHNNMDKPRNVKFATGNLLHLPYKNNQFDITLCLNILPHILETDLFSGVSELTRISKKYVILTIKNKDNLYMKYIHPKNFGGIRVYIHSKKEIDFLMKNNNFKFIKQKGIFLFNWLSPLVLLVYERIIFV